LSNEIRELKEKIGKLEQDLKKEKEEK